MSTILMVFQNRRTEMNEQETCRYHLFDLSSDLKMLKQLLREKEVGFPTPPDEDAEVDLIIWTAEEHLRYLAHALGLDPTFPAPAEIQHWVAAGYPLGEGRMTDEEYKKRKTELKIASLFS
jgi:hypothetical protein